MDHEYDYSGLYNTNGQGQPNGEPNRNPEAQNTQNAQPAQNSAQPAQNTQPAQNAQPAQSAENSAPQDSGYPNVGSSGMNTANTARTDYGSSYGASGSETSAPSGQSAQYAQPAQSAPYSQPRQGQGGYADTANANNEGYASSFGSGANAGGYSYASAPQQGKPEKTKRKGSGKKIALRIAACVGVAALGFGGGLAGAAAADRLGLTNSGQVVVQQVVHDASGDTSATVTGSTGGEAALTTAEIAAMTKPSVVAITTEQMVTSDTWYGGSYIQSGAGSGVIISDDGYILTCAHVVSGATNITIATDDGTEYTATVVGSDSSSDIAIIKIEATGLTPATIGDSDALVAGEETVAVGNPLGTLGGSVTEGIVSAVDRTVTVNSNQMTLIQTSASISPGNSGGGLFNASGELIGIVNAKSGSTNAEGIGFAIPINDAMEIAEQLITNGAVERPAMGVTVYTVSDTSTAAQLGVSALGVYVTSVNEGSGAEAAGVQAGDRIIAIGDVAVSTSQDVTGYLKDKAIGDTVTLQVERDGKILSMEVTLGSSTQS